MKKNQIGLLLGLLGVLIAILAYFYGFQKINEKTDALNAESTALEAKIAKYEAWLPNQEKYVSDTATMKTEIQKVLTEYPSYILPEDDMKLAYELDTPYGEEFLFINSLAFAEPENLFTTDYSGISKYQEETGVNIAIDGSYNTYSLYQQITNYGFNSTYEGVKSMIARIYAQQKKKGISTVSLGYDASTGILNGNVTMNSYYLTGTDVPYAQPKLVPVPKGTENPFGTLEEMNMESAEEEMTEGETADTAAAN